MTLTTVGARPAPLGPATFEQSTFDDLGTPLREVTFVVVDLETTGAAPATAQITEIGAVRVRGGEVLGEFATLVNPGGPVPGFISVLTGITDAMVARAPRLEAVLPAFLEFARGAVLVAHNAGFDLGFLHAACERLGCAWPQPRALDTVRLARAVLDRAEAPDCRLATLARLFRTETAPCHRALADARATVEVLHALIARVGNRGVHSLEELQALCRRASLERRRKRHLAEALPDAPGVYVFRDAGGRTLYVGKSKAIRTRVRSYFTAAETRARIGEMIRLAAEIVPIPCATALEAEVRELRLIAERKPPYNRRSRFPERSAYLKLTREPFPRLSLVRCVRDDGATYLGPFPSAHCAELALAALHEAFLIRRCSQRISRRRPVPACALAGLGRCRAPCEGAVPIAAYGTLVGAVRDAMVTDPTPVVAAAERRMAVLVAGLRYEEAAIQRDRLAAFLQGAARLQRLTALSTCPQLAAARPARQGGWELHVVRHGRLAAAGVAPAGSPARPVVDALIATAETVLAGPGPAPAASAEEMECVLRWLTGDGARLVDVQGVWCSPAFGAGRRAGRAPAGPRERDGP